MIVEMILKAVIGLPLIFILSGYIMFNAFAKEKMRELDFSEVIFLQILGSVLISGWIGLTLAEFGYFSLPNLLILLVVFSGLLGWKYKVKFNLKLFPKPKLDYKSLALIIILLIAVGLFYNPYPWILGGRDPGVYVNTGVNIAKTGSIISYDPLLASMDESTQQTFYQIETRPEVLNVKKYEGTQFPGFYISNKTTGEITPQFYYLWSTWIAIFYTLFGLKVGLYITPFFGVLSILSIYFTGKILFNRNVGLIASLLLTLNFAQIWYARYPTTEIFTQFLIFSGIFTFIIFYRYLDKYFGLISALCFGGALLTRIDSIYLLVPIFLFFGYLWLCDKLKTKHLYFIIPFVLLCIHAIATAVFISAPYTFDIFQSFRGLFMLSDEPYLILIGFIAIIAFLSLINSHKNKIEIKLRQGKKFVLYIQHIATILIFVLILYAFFIRPTGELTSDSYNLVKLSWYMSGFFGILLASLGCILLLYKKPYSETYFFLTTVIIYSIFYIMAARISPDHPWWVRRYLPVVIPSAVICTAYFIDWINDLQIGGWNKINKIVAITLLTLLLIPSVMSDSKIIHNIEYSGAIENTNDLSHLFEKNSIILYHRNYYTDKVATPLYYIYNKNIRPVTNNEKLLDNIHNWIDSNKTVYLVDIVSSDDIIDINNKERFIKYPVDWTTLHGMHWKNHSYFNIPDDYRTERHVFNILVLQDLEDINEITLLNTNWYGLEYWHDVPTRWMSNNATIPVYSNEYRTTNMSLNVTSFFEPKTLQVYSGNNIVHEQNISAHFEEMEISFELNKGINIIKFYTPNGCQRPADIPELKNRDTRRLSFAFQNITLT